MDWGGLFRFLLGITGGSFPISRWLHLFLALDTPLASAGWAGDAVSARGSSAAPCWLCGTLLGTDSLKIPCQAHLSHLGNLQLLLQHGLAGPCSALGKAQQILGTCRDVGRGCGQGRRKSIRREGKGREASPAGRRALLPPAPSSSCKLRRLRSCSGFLGSPIDAKAILEREGE